MEDGGSRPTTLAENAVEFLDPFAGIREVHQPHVTNYCIKALIGEAKSLSVFNGEGRIRETRQSLAGAIKHVR
jgi:hypothetical protein